MNDDIISRKAALASLHGLHNSQASAIIYALPAVAAAAPDLSVLERYELNEGCDCGACNGTSPHMESGYDGEYVLFEAVEALLSVQTSAPAAPAVKVKPLVWRDCTDGTSHDEGCQYEIEKDGKFWRVIRAATGGGVYVCHSQSLEAAKAAAQADYEASILSAIEVGRDGL